MQTYRVNEGRRELPMQTGEGKRMVQPGETFEGADGLHKQSRFTNWITPVDADGKPMADDDRIPAHARAELVEQEQAALEADYQRRKAALDERLKTAREAAEAAQTAAEPPAEPLSAPQGAAEAPGKGAGPGKPSASPTGAPAASVSGAPAQVKTTKADIQNG